VREFLDPPAPIRRHTGEAGTRQRTAAIRLGLPVVSPVRPPEPIRARGGERGRSAMQGRAPVTLPDRRIRTEEYGPCH
jgi:hypothetical protein